MAEMLRQYTCKICKGRFEFGKVKYLDDGKSLACIECIKKMNKLKSSKEEKPKAINEEPKKLKLICVDCRYKFAISKKSSATVRCPYCSGSNLLKDETTAEKLVEEIRRGDAS